MSQNLEEIFRSALKDQEVPFDSKAWESMSARLDEVMPVKPKGGSNSLWIAASVAAAVGLATWGYFNSTSEPTQTNEPVQITQEKPSTRKVEEKTSTTTTVIAENDEEKLIETTLPVEEAAPVVVKKSVQNTPIAETGNEVPKEIITEKPKKEVSNVPTSNPYKPTESYPTFGSICQFDLEIIQNPFKLPLEVVSPKGKKLVIEAESKGKIKFDEAGDYTMTVGDKKPAKIHVGEKPVFDFEMGSFNEFENGVPSLFVQATGQIKDPVWTIKNDRVSYKGETANIHLYEKGMYELILSGSSQSGCSSSVQKMVTVDENYNLLAPTGFTPYDSDPRKSTFMPYALKERNTDFVLIISDRRTGEKLFSTSDANNGWDGMIQNSGKMAEYNVEYIWTVSIASPLPGEKSKYSGTVKLRK